MTRARRLWRATRIPILVFFVVVFGPVLVGLIGVGFQCRPFGGPDSQGDVQTVDPPHIQRVKAGLTDYQRPEDQTYLTLPEWYIVYSAEEYAAFMADSSPSRFPYFRAAAQFWQSYYDVCAVTREQYAFNGEYHVVLMVIGASFTIENVLRGLYENTIGRLAQWTSGDERVEEEVYAQEVATEYGAFLHTIPWYEFPFGEKLRGLWRETSLWGPNIIRKWERKMALSVEYGSKALYALMIKGGTQAAFSAQELKIQAWAEGVTDQLLSAEAELELVAEIDDQAAIVAIPRYEMFTQVVPHLTRRGVRFVEIAGNDEILVTAIATEGWDGGVNDAELLFEMPILTQPGSKRVALNVPVRFLHSVLNNLGGPAIRLEHIYDY